MAYEKDKDYQALINSAVSSGDYISAAKYEQQRNEKIAGLNASGSNIYNATPTNNYSKWLNFNGSATGVGAYTDAQKAIVDQMNANSLQWHGADQATKDSLHAQNQYLSGLLGGNVQYSQSGDWIGSAAYPATGAGGLGTSQPTFDSNAYVDSNPKPTYTSQQSAQIDALLDQVLNREAFSYDPETDPLYQQYKAQYNREGTRAMNDTLAAAASNAGGMNSYAITAAQQANDYYSTQLADKIPELYQLAYSMYLDDIDGKVRDLGLLQGMDDRQYDRYRDTMSDWYNDRDFAYGQYRDDMGDYQWGLNYNHGVAQDAIANEHWDKTFAQGQYEFDKTMSQDQAQFDATLAQNKYEFDKSFGLSQDQFDWEKYLAEQGYDIPGYTPNGGGGDTPKEDKPNGSGGNGGSGYDNAGLTDSEVKALQAYYGISNPDGKWGPNSTEQTGMTAAQAWKKAIASGDFTVGNWDSGEEAIGRNLYDNVQFPNQEAAVTFMKKNGVSDDDIATLVPKIDWERRRNSYLVNGNGGPEVSENETYQEYLADFVNYMLSSR